nr:hypothetical protein [Arthrobacter sp. KBS0702]
MAVAGGVDAVNTGAAWAALTVMVRAGVTASGLTPFVAATVNVEDPADVGVPDNTPVPAFRLNPAGKDPDATLKVGAGLPDAANV